MPNIVTLGTVLVRRNLGEADRVLNLYTEQLGKISAIAKSVRKPKSKVAGHLEPGNVVRFELATGRTFYIVTAAKVQTRFRFSSLEQMQSLFIWLELIDKVTLPEGANTGLFALIERGLEAASHPQHSRLNVTYTELELYSTIGYNLELKHCILGREDLKSADNMISLREGGIVCSAHCASVPLAIPISPEAIKVLRLITAGDTEILQRMHLTESVQQEMLRIVRLQRNEVLEKELKSEHLQ